MKKLIGLTIAILLLSLACCAQQDDVVIESASGGSAIQGKSFRHSPFQFTSPTIDLRFRRLEGGEFMMGSDLNFFGAGAVYGPPHQVKVSPFYMAVYEVTKGQFRKFMEETGEGQWFPDWSEENTRSIEQKFPRESTQKAYIYASRESHPVAYCDWFTAKKFAAWLSEKDGVSYRLATEAEWEYAARGGTSDLHWWGRAWQDNLTKWREGFTAQQVSPFKWLVVPGTYPSNPFGLYEMYGNAFEWVEDWRNNQYYQNSPVDNPKGPETGQEKVRRGGWLGSENYGCNSVSRSSAVPSSPIGGIRLVCEANDRFLEKHGLDSPENLDEKTWEFQEFPKGLPNRCYTLRLDDNVFLYMAEIPAGSFTLGRDTTGCETCSDQEGPPTHVNMEKGFSISRLEVTQKVYQAIMEKNPSRFQGLHHPVDSISFYEAALFCEKLTEHCLKQKLIPFSYEFRLPSEIEWEYACRAGTEGGRFFDESKESLENYAWFDVLGGTRPVGRKKMNPWGLYDVYGNVWEWCIHSYWPYTGGEPVGLSWDKQDTKFRMVRGGGWSSADHRCRSVVRYAVDWGGLPWVPEPVRKYDFMGIRVVLAEKDDRAEFLRKILKVGPSLER